ncbi:hypothetical protein PHET_01510 [Paragonimus heterotremus]|uniref:SHSP domain-containing protein n=1 Tax=Paragonimus heterotremus TaxID=100268 RepID=A0A8J4TM88_9TREM|nr:hypothetical protein PHET_01510 [Paragonimus heterotremus]
MHPQTPVYSSSSRANASRRDSEARATSPSQPRYIRDQNGTLKYVTEVNLQGVPRSDLNISTQQNVLVISAVYESISESGDKCTHEVYREIHLPTNVYSDRMKCTYTEPGIITIFADADEPQYPLSPSTAKRDNPFVYPKQTMWNRPTSPSTPRKPLINIDPRRVTFAEPVTIHPAAKPTYPRATTNLRINTIPPSDKARSRVRSPEPTYATHVNKSPALSPYHSNNPDRLHQPPVNSSTLNTCTSHAAQPLKRYTLRVEIGSHITPGDLQITRNNGVLVIHARRYIQGNLLETNSRPERLLFEHRSEHTLPNNVSLTGMTARLDNGVVYVDAPYIQFAPGKTVKPSWLNT